MNSKMFERKIFFDQNNLTDEFKKLLAQDAKLANHEIPFFEGKLTLQQLCKSNVGGGAGACVLSL